MNMSTFSLAGSSAERPAPPHTYLVNATLWLLASMIAVFFALLLRDSAIIGDMYIPRTNDSFYHARRILDAAVGERGFYQFDERLHVPDGAWISWPWAYDYLVAKATQLVLFFRPGMDPMAFISHVPVAWILINASLLLGICQAIGLSAGMRSLAMLGFALSPLTQLLHGIGMIDHHYVEHTFVLLMVWLGIRWFAAPASAGRAATLAAALGAAPAFHNGLFMLQLAPLGGLLLLWLRHREPPRASLITFAAVLVAVTQLILLPSAPYRQGMFEFGLLSWFHFYVACATAGVAAFMAFRPFTVRSFGALVGLSAAAALPLAAQVLQGAAFLSTEFSVLQYIVEARSPYRLFTETFGPWGTASYYTWLLLLVPVLTVVFAIRALREKQPDQLYYAVAVTFGLAMMQTQFRFYYFGMFALLTAGLVLIDEQRKQRGWHAGLTFVATLAALFIAYQPALRERLFTIYAPGADSEYASTLAIMLELDEQCANDPGTVLANSDDGSPILFHSECSVISNNFILRPEDEAKINEIRRLMKLSPAEIRAQTLPRIKYLFIRADYFSTPREGELELTRGNPIVEQLFLAETPPPGYTLLREIQRRFTETSEPHVYARLYKITPLPE